jgi:tetratricopeptide (TPR) repeat protein
MKNFWAKITSRAGMLWTRAIRPLGKWILPQMKFGTVLACVIVIWFVVYQFIQIRRSVVILEPITVPQQYADAGFSSEVITQRVRDRLQIIEKSDETATLKDRLSDQPDAAFQSIEIPDTGIPLRAVAVFLQQAFGDERRHLASSITLAPPDQAGKRSALLWYRVAGGTDEDAFERYPLDAADPEKVAEALADRFMMQLNPYLLGVFYINEGDFQNGSDVAKFMLSKGSPNNHYNATAHILLGYIAKSENKLDEATMHYNMAIDLDPQLPNPHTTLAAVLELENKDDAAIEELNKAIALDHKHKYYAPHLNLGLILVKSPGGLKNAMNEFRTALRIDPGHVETHIALGIAFYDSGDHNNGINELKKAVALAPDNAVAHYSLGLYLLASNNNVSQGIEELDCANKLKPGIGKVYELLGRGLEQQGDMKNAIENYQKANAAFPNDSNLREHLKELAQKYGVSLPKNFSPTTSLTPTGNQH